MSGVVAVHLRRGDYKRHCPRLAGWRAEYIAFNKHVDLVDRFDWFHALEKYEAQRNASSNPISDEERERVVEEYYLEHCLPTHEQIVDKLRILRKERPGLKRVYVLTNGWGFWFNGLKSKLLEDGWEDMKGSLDVRLDKEQDYVGMAVDMAIAEKAEVFLGNGVGPIFSIVLISPLTAL
jgi:FMN phosphatase YigB (HAD superfamily)